MAAGDTLTIIHDIEEMRAYAAEARASGFQVGLVPTMGALHEGHLSLVRRAAGDNGRTIVSVFVNPIQFDDPGDFASYPETLAADAEAASAAGADAVFAPAASGMYPDGFSTHVDMTGLSERLCGAARESHFRGVLTVVAKLFGICMPHRAYFGEKDAQQLAVVQRMAADLNMDIDIVACPTVREEDGLAMSSRNARLTAAERLAARSLYLALCAGKALFDTGERDPGRICAEIDSVIKKEQLIRVEYAQIVDSLTFDSVTSAREGCLAALAAYAGSTRLIDNLRL